MNTRKRWVISWILLAAILLSFSLGCSGGSTNSTTTATPTPVSTHTATPTPVPTHTATPTPVPTHTATPTTPAMEFVTIPAGNFTMGTEDGYYIERPQHQIYIDAYAIGKYEVTNAQFAAFCLAKPYTAPGDWQNADGALTGYSTNYPNNPVICVSWYDAKAFCDYYGWRLPTEAEWEKAARGTDGRVYPWGNTWYDDLCNHFDGPQLSGRANLYGNGRGTLPVGAFPFGASPYGCMDMIGNVWEWCNDWFSDSYYPISPSSNPQGPGSGSYRVRRGGAWYGGLGLRCAYRHCDYPDVRNNYLGFRVVR